MVQVCTSLVSTHQSTQFKHTSLTLIGTWALPGGHLEFGETFETCAEREALEETGLNITNFQYLTTINDVMEDEGKHYVTIIMGSYAIGAAPVAKVSTTSSNNLYKKKQANAHFLVDNGARKVRSMEMGQLGRHQGVS